jgi:uncharacterized protein YjaG (DUF416 family)
MLIVTSDLTKVINIDKMSVAGIAYLEEDKAWIVASLDNFSDKSWQIVIAKYDTQDKAQRTLRDILDAYNDNQRVFYVDV